MIIFVVVLGVILAAVTTGLWGGKHGNGAPRRRRSSYHSGIGGDVYDGGDSGSYGDGGSGGGDCGGSDGGGGGGGCD